MSEKISLVFMGTPEFAVPTLEALTADGGFDVKLVVTQPDRPKGRGRRLLPTPVKVAAQQMGIDLIQPAKARDDKCVMTLSEINPDFLVVVAYGQILPLTLLDIPAVAPVNLHASLLPRWRGAAPIHRAFLEGDDYTGVCSMKMDVGLDTGGVLLCEKVPIRDEDTLGDLHDKLATIGANLIVTTLKKYKAGEIEPDEQDEAGATYAKKLEKSDFVIHWDAVARDVSRKIRGLSPLPGGVARLNGKGVKLLFAKAVDRDSGASPGSIVSITENGIEVACAQGSVLISQLKPEGKATMDAYAFTHGGKVSVGDRFELLERPEKL